MRPRPASAASAWTRMLTVYAILALAAFAFPGGLVEWLDNRNDSGWLSAPLALVKGVDAVSAAVGVKGVGVALRKRFAGWIGDDQG